MTKLNLQDRFANILAFGFTIVILIYAASGPIGECVKWFIEISTADFEELSRRDQRNLYKTHWLGAIYRSFERYVLLPTGMILGLPVLFSFAVMILSNDRWGVGLRWLLFAASSLILSIWIARAVCGGWRRIAKRANRRLLFVPWRNDNHIIADMALFWRVYRLFLPVLDYLFLCAWLVARMVWDFFGFRKFFGTIHAIYGVEFLVTNGGDVWPALAGCIGQCSYFHRIWRGFGGQWRR